MERHLVLYIGSGDDQMAKFKLSIDTDIVFVILSAEAMKGNYAVSLQAGVKRSRQSGVTSTLPAPDVLDLPSDQHEEIQSDPEGDPDT